MYALMPHRVFGGSSGLHEDVSGAWTYGDATIVIIIRLEKTREYVRPLLEDRPTVSLGVGLVQKPLRRPLPHRSRETGLGGGVTET